jgi:hypothetical protein
MAKKTPRNEKEKVNWLVCESLLMGQDQQQHHTVHCRGVSKYILPLWHSGLALKEDRKYTKIQFENNSSRDILWS